MMKCVHCHQNVAQWQLDHYCPQCGKDQNEITIRKEFSFCRKGSIIKTNTAQLVLPFIEPSEFIED